MANEIVARMDDTTFGWQYAIGQHGKLVANDSRGTARSKKDAGDHASIARELDRERTPA